MSAISNNSNAAVEAPPQPPTAAAKDRGQKPQTERPSGAFEQRLDGQLSALQSMLSSLAAKVEAMEEDAEHGLLRPDQQQGAVADAFKDMTQVEHAVGQLEPRLDLLLSKLDSLLEGNDADVDDEKPERETPAV
ncbi:hypothetical protein IWW37_003731 [Coemansia sp. RSA 2050]|nr:hypothetical protein IWW37_003731 [Coemansia sp. RSA 2050]